MTSTSTAARRGKGTGANGARKAAFLTAPLGADTKVIRKVLDRLGLDAFTADEVDLPGKALPEILQECIDRADLVVAVIDDPADSGNVFFELGFAKARNKRALVVMDTDEALPMVRAFGTPYLRTRADNPEALEFGLSQLLAAPHHGSRKFSEEIPRQTHSIGPLADELLAAVRSGGSLSENQLQEIIRRAIEASGVSAASQARAPNAVIDLAVWSDDLEPWIPNPLIIEIRDTLRGKGEVAAAVRQLHKHMAATKVAWSLLLYRSASPSALKAVPAPHILSLPVEEFLESLRHTGFGELIRGLRKRKVHGAS